MKSILSILVISICVGMYFLYIKPLTVEIKVKNAQKAEYTKVLNRVKDIKEKREAIIADYNSISPEEVERLNKIVPEKINSVALLNDLNTIAERYSLVIKDFKLIESDNASHDVVNQENSGTSKTNQITLHVNGSYTDFLNFLEDIEYSLSLMDIVTLNIIPGSLSKNGEATTMEFALEANTYSLR
jgi:Tfp pilus assembly protein PilO